MNLSELKPREVAVITKINLDNEIKTRLINLGLFVGGEVRLERIAPLNDPIEYIISGNFIAIRKQDAEMIEIESVVK